MAKEETNSGNNQNTNQNSGEEALKNAQAKAAQRINNASMTGNRKLADGLDTVAPITEQHVVTIAEVSDKIEREGREFRMISMVEGDGSTLVLPMADGFYEANKNKVAPDVTVVITLLNTIKDRTHYDDRRDGKRYVHTTDGKAFANVTLATSTQGKVALVDVLAKKLEQYENRPNLVGAMSNLYRGLLD